jgi:hypothetical protein
VVIDKDEPSVVGYDAFAGLPDAVGRDVVVFDARATGYSEPTLTCDEVDYLMTVLEVDPSRRAPYLDALGACRERLEGEGVDLTAFTVRSIADDVIDIRRALGYDTWNVIGYGLSTARAWHRSRPCASPPERTGDWTSLQTRDPASTRPTEPIIQFGVDATLSNRQ